MSRVRILSATVFTLGVGGGLAWQALAAQPAEARKKLSSDWNIEAGKSLLYVQVFKDQDTIAASQAHDHVIRADGFRSRLSFDPAHPQKCSLSLVIPVKRLAVDEPRMRRRVGYESSMSASTRKQVRKNMLAESQLNAQRYPNIAIRASNCRRLGDGRYQPDVKITIRGRSHTVRPKLRLKRSGEQITVTGQFTVQHKDFGLEPYSAYLGAVANAQPIRFVARVKARNH